MTNGMSIHAGTAAWYVKNWKAAKAELATGRTIRFCWPGTFPKVVNQEQFNREMREALDRRINERGGVTYTGRKHGEMYQTELRRDCRNIREHVTRRLAVHQIMTKELQGRFAHYISDWRD